MTNVLHRVFFSLLLLAVWGISAVYGQLANRQILFNSAQSSHPYRIPAIAQVKNGNLLAMSDYRLCGGDIGQGHVNIVGKISADQGQTWGEEFAVATGNGDNSSNTCGYGDAALVADRSSNRVLMMSCSAPNPGLCWSAAQRSVMAVSEDGGRTWPVPTDIKDKIMSVLPADRINYFVGSGKLCQSRYIKVGKYYRVYAALWTTRGNDLQNFVVYTDDFGDSWSLLGSVDICPGPNGNEPKCEELPNGDVLLSARQPWHRLLNIFHYESTPTVAQPALGHWDTPAAGIENSDAPGTNGEVLILKVVKPCEKCAGKLARGKHKVCKACQKKAQYLALQSAPNGGKRAKVTIWYKWLGSGKKADGVWDTPANFGKDWTVGLQVTEFNSAYSTMCLQHDGRIAFYYEDMESGFDSDMMYVPLRLEELGLKGYSVCQW